MVGAGVLVLSASGLYRRRICAVRAAEVARIGRASLLLGIAAAVLSSGAGREAALVAGSVGAVVWFVVLGVERGVFREWIQSRRASGDFGAPVIVVAGTAEAGLDLSRFLVENQVLGYDVLGLVCPIEPDLPRSHTPWLGCIDRLDDPLARVDASGLVLDAHSLTTEQLSVAVLTAGTHGLHTHISTGMRGVDRRRISVSPLADETFLHVAPLQLARSQVIAKRFLDVVLGWVALLLLMPVLLLVGFAIWLHDHGPVFYRQRRVGKDGEPFTLYKLRTMELGAEDRRQDLGEQNGRNGPLFKLARDPRVTPVGRLLRASSLDEAPQLLNVLEGTMSLVGPRPALPEEVAQFDEELTHRLRVKPGMTGLWQVEARDLANFDLYRRFDLLYVENWSIGLDLALIARTVVVVPLRTLRSLMPARWRQTEAPGLD
jgi:exopolysaccharide biosynthesis polyprenyl glycosylphosphotransferase